MLKLVIIIFIPERKCYTLTWNCKERHDGFSNAMYLELKTPEALVKIRKDWQLNLDDDDYEVKFTTARNEALIKWLEINSNEFGFTFRKEAIL